MLAANPFEVEVRAFAACEIARDAALIGPPCDVIEVHFVLAGTLHLAAAGGEPLVCPPGSVVLVPAGLEQAMSASAVVPRAVHAADVRHEADGFSRFDAADGAPGAVRLVCGQVAADARGLAGAIRRPLVERLGGEALADALFAGLLAELDAPSRGGRALMGALMKAALVRMLQLWAAREGSPAWDAAFDDPRLARAAAAVVERPGAAHSVASLAALAGMSRSAFARDFAATHGLTPMDYVARVRLHHAAELLRGTDRPVKTVAGEAGYASRSHFSRAFRRLHGIDPRRFRQGCKGASAETAR